MAAITITTDTNWQDVATATGITDTIAINGAILTIDTDSRYCTNHDATTGSLGTVTLSSTLKGSQLFIDGTGVRLIPYDTGTGNEQYWY